MAVVDGICFSSKGINYTRVEIFLLMFTCIIRLLGFTLNFFEIIDRSSEIYSFKAL